MIGGAKSSKIMINRSSSQDEHSRSNSNFNGVTKLSDPEVSVLSPSVDRNRIYKIIIVVTFILAALSSDMPVGTWI